MATKKIRRPSSTGAGESKAYRRTMSNILATAKNVRPYRMWDHTRILAAGPSREIRFYTSGIGQDGSASDTTAGAKKNLFDTNLRSNGELSKGEEFIAFGFYKTYVKRWLTYGAAQVNRKDDYENLVKDVEQLEGAMYPTFEFSYGSNIMFYQTPVYTAPERTGSSTNYYGNPGLVTDVEWFGKGALLNIDEDTNLICTERFITPAAFGSGSFVIQGVFLQGIAFMPMGATSGRKISELKKIQAGGGY